MQQNRANANTFAVIAHAISHAIQTGALVPADSQPPELKLIKRRYGYRVHVSGLVIPAATIDRTAIR